MSRQQTDQSNILAGANESLKILWEKRDAALRYEKKYNMTPRTSDRYLKAQAEVDAYFMPEEKKAKRKKPKKKPYNEDDWYGL